MAESGTGHNGEHLSSTILTLSQRISLWFSFNLLPYPLFLVFRPYHGPGVDWAPSENEYQEHFLGLKAAVAWGWRPHTFMCRMSWKSGSLNFLEPSGPHRACCGNPPSSIPCCFTNSSISLQTCQILVSVTELCYMFEDLYEGTCGFNIPHEERFFENIADPWNVKWFSLFDDYRCFRGT
jgi:hypothetical protein